MKRLFPLLLFIFPVAASGQNEKFSLRISGWPAVQFFAPVKGFEHQFSATKLNWGTGIEGDYYFSDKNAVGFGLDYFTLNYRLKYAWTFQQPGDPKIPRTTNVNSSWLEIPLCWDFTTAGKNVDITGRLGAFYAAQIKSSELTEFEDNSVRPSQYQRKSEYGMLWAAGLAFHFQNTFSIHTDFSGHLYMGPLSEFLERGLGGEFKIGISYRFS